MRAGHGLPRRGPGPPRVGAEIRTELRVDPGTTVHLQLYGIHPDGRRPGIAAHADFARLDAGVRTGRVDPRGRMHRVRPVAPAASAPVRRRRGNRDGHPPHRLGVAVLAGQSRHQQTGRTAVLAGQRLAGHPHGEEATGTRDLHRDHVAVAVHGLHHQPPVLGRPGPVQQVGQADAGPPRAAHPAAADRVVHAHQQQVPLLQRQCEQLVDP